MRPTAPRRRPAAGARASQHTLGSGALFAEPFAEIRGSRLRGARSAPASAHGWHLPVHDHHDGGEQTLHVRLGKTAVAYDARVHAIVLGMERHTAARVHQRHESLGPFKRHPHGHGVAQHVVDRAERAGSQGARDSQPQAGVARVLDGGLPERVLQGRVEASTGLGPAPRARCSPGRGCAPHPRPAPRDRRLPRSSAGPRWSRPIRLTRHTPQ